MQFLFFDYLPNLSSYLNANYGYTYQNEYSGQFIYNKNVTTVYNLLYTLNSMNWNYNGARIGMGMGCVGWTFDRAYTLIQTYREVNNNSSTITLAQARIAEALLVSRELCGGYYYVYNWWCSRNSPYLNTPEAAYDAGWLICIEYERPLYTNQAVIRGDLAVLIYNDID